VHKDFEANVLYATRHYASADKVRNEFSAADINWIAGAPPMAGVGGHAADAEHPLELRVKVRHGAESHAAHVTLLDGGRRAHVQLAERDKGLAPGALSRIGLATNQLAVTATRVRTAIAAGQFAAFYDGDVCLGSGAISEGGI
jgi:tRNA-specific 2-thiouridylase